MAYHHNEYVPLVEKEVTTEIETLNAQVKLKASEMHCILFGGDQLTAAHARSAKRHVANADKRHWQVAWFDSCYRRLAHKDESIIGKYKIIRVFL